MRLAVFLTIRYEKSIRFWFLEKSFIWVSCLTISMLLQGDNNQTFVLHTSKTEPEDLSFSVGRIIMHCLPLLGAAWPCFVVSIYLVYPYLPLIMIFSVTLFSPSIVPYYYYKLVTASRNSLSSFCCFLCLRLYLHSRSFPLPEKNSIYISLLPYHCPILVCTG